MANKLGAFYRFISSHNANRSSISVITVGAGHTLTHSFAIKHYCFNSYLSSVGVLLIAYLALVRFTVVIRPPDIICRRTYILPGILSSFLSSFFRRLISELAERNSTIFGHMVGSKCNLKMHVRNMGYPIPVQTWGPKTTFLDDFATQRQL